MSVYYSSFDAPCHRALKRPGLEKRTKSANTVVLTTMGLTVSDALRLLPVRVAQEKALHLEPLFPHAETIEAIKETRRGITCLRSPPR